MAITRPRAKSHRHECTVKASCAWNPWTYEYNNAVASLDSGSEFNRFAGSTSAVTEFVSSYRLPEHDSCEIWITNVASPTWLRTAMTTDDKRSTAKTVYTYIRSYEDGAKSQDADSIFHAIVAEVQLVFRIPRLRRICLTACTRMFARTRTIFHISWVAQSAYFTT